MNSAPKTPPQGRSRIPTTPAPPKRRKPQRRSASPVTPVPRKRRRHHENVARKEQSVSKDNLNQLSLSMFTIPLPQIIPRRGNTLATLDLVHTLGDTTLFWYGRHSLHLPALEIAKIERQNKTKKLQSEEEIAIHLIRAVGAVFHLVNFELPLDREHIFYKYCAPLFKFVTTKPHVNLTSRIASHLIERFTTFGEARFWPVAAKAEDTSGDWLTQDRMMLLFGVPYSNSVDLEALYRDKGTDGGWIRQVTTQYLETMENRFIKSKGPATAKEILLGIKERARQALKPNPLNVVLREDFSRSRKRCLYIHKIRHLKWCDVEIVKGMWTGELEKSLVVGSEERDIVNKCAGSPDCADGCAMPGGCAEVFGPFTYREFRLTEAGRREKIIIEID